MKNPESQQLIVAGVGIELLRKRVRNVNFRIYPPDGRVRVSAPLRMGEREIRRAVEAKLDWILRQRTRIAEQPRPPAMRLESGELHLVDGRRCRLEVVDLPGVSRAELLPGDVLRLQVPPETDAAGRLRVLEGWYRQRFTDRLPQLLARWEAVVGRRARDCRVRRMRTLWGSCSTGTGRIRLNLELARRSVRCQEYVLVHELTHLHERGHTRRFYALMDRFLPDWRERKRELEQHPLWRYHDESGVSAL
ncbi:M48 family metallopeptidase [Spirochaeta africana]|uniref:Putative metal-dependent hydrolase n=1 Tax=Spirochaeta africana (strain ATCC 700263 / DSM 8902 / Z-7692) TaxID=889378 RepID=H9UFD3_SPIAZ|nr:SprT family zinc-dependent metalloprotease [Spirochaeta africana]AFG36226.1 putative metal-dependent hydrolase [Spirochaeta africana DSM 8902]